MASAIFKDIEKGNVVGVKRLVSVYPNSVQARSPSDNRTPLHVAASVGNLSIVRELLVHGASFDAVDKDGNTPLHLACENGNSEIVEELLTGPGRKLLVKSKNKDGQTPLHFAARFEHGEAASKLMLAGARADAKDKAGQTPLDLASPSNSALMQALTNVSASQPPATPTRATTSGSGSDGMPPPSPSTLTTRPTSGALRRSGTLDSAVASGSGAAANVALSKKVDTVECSVQVLQVQCQELQAQLQRMDSYCNAQSELTEQWTRALDLMQGLKASVDELETRLVFQEGKTREMRLRVDKLEEQNNEASIAERSRRQTSDAAQQGVAALSSELAVMQRTLHELATQVNQAKTLAAASAPPADNKLASQLHSVESQLGALQTLLAALPISAIQSSQTEQARQIAELTEWVRQQRDQQQQHQEQLKLLDQRLQQLPANGTSNGGALIPAAAQPDESAAAAAASSATLDARVTERLFQGLESAALCIAEHNEQLLSLQQSMKGLQEQVQMPQSPSRSLTPSLSRGHTPLPETPRDPRPSSSIGGSIGSLSMTPPTVVWDKLERQQSGGPGGGSPAPGDVGSMMAGLQGEVEMLREALTGLKVDMAKEHSSLRHQWDRSLLELKQRYTEQQAELQARERSIAGLREAALMEEAERRAREGLADKISSRLTALEHGLDLMTHKLEVVEEQVTTLAATVSCTTPLTSPKMQAYAHPSSPPARATATPPPLPMHTSMGTRGPGRGERGGKQPLAESVVRQLDLSSGASRVPTPQPPPPPNASMQPVAASTTTAAAAGTGWEVVISTDSYNMSPLPACFLPWATAQMSQTNTPDSLAATCTSSQLISPSHHISPSQLVDVLLPASSMRRFDIIRSEPTESASKPPAHTTIAWQHSAPYDMSGVASIGTGSDIPGFQRLRFGLGEGGDSTTSDAWQGKNRLFMTPMTASTPPPASQADAHDQHPACLATTTLAAPLPRVIQSSPQGAQFEDSFTPVTQLPITTSLNLEGPPAAAAPAFEIVPSIDMSPTCSGGLQYTLTGPIQFDMMTPPQRNRSSPQLSVPAPIDSSYIPGPVNKAALPLAGESEVLDSSCEGPSMSEGWVGTDNQRNRSRHLANSEGTRSIPRVPHIDMSVPLDHGELISILAKPARPGVMRSISHNVRRAADRVGVWLARSPGRKPRTNPE